jgi:hypothetical protein
LHSRFLTRPTWPIFHPRHLLPRQLNQMSRMSLTPKDAAVAEAEVP